MKPLYHQRIVLGKIFRTQSACQDLRILWTFSWQNPDETVPEWILGLLLALNFGVQIPRVPHAWELSFKICYSALQPTTRVSTTASSPERLIHLSPNSVSILRLRWLWREWFDPDSRSGLRLSNAPAPLWDVHAFRLHRFAQSVGRGFGASPPHRLGSVDVLCELRYLHHVILLSAVAHEIWALRNRIQRDLPHNKTAQHSEIWF